MRKTALIAGATGATAKRLVEVLLADPDWSVVGVSRNPPASAERLTYIAADLLDPALSKRALAECSGVTHVFYTARAKFGEGGVESVEDNAAMLRNVLDAIEPAARGLAHVHLVEGGKYYGQHLGPYPTPTREDDPRHMPPNFYYDQQDLLVERQRGKSWTWSASRPNLICDFAPDRARNLVSLIGAYAAHLRGARRAVRLSGTAGLLERAHRGHRCDTFRACDGVHGDRLRRRRTRRSTSPTAICFAGSTCGRASPPISA